MGVFTVIMLTGAALETIMSEEYSSDIVAVIAQVISISASVSASA